MELGEKLQELRKSRGLTQEELAQALFVSRTAVSKWESGRGYPSIDSLKEISKFFSVSIDALLSGEKLISIAEKENRANIRKMCNLLQGIADLFAFGLIVLPLYARPLDGHIYAVNLLSHMKTAAFPVTIYWMLFLALIAVGIAKVVLTQLRIDKGQSVASGCSFGLSILAIFLLTMTREAYALTVAFMLLLIKGILLLIHTRNA